jgi:N-acetyl-anhydromuramyl-L-alanine amidase AmpD
MNITKRYMTMNRCYTNPTKINVTKLVLHSLGCAQPNANVLIDSWNNAEAGVSIHAFIMDTGIIQTLPWDYKAWHVGKGSKGSYNSCSIGVEICEPSGHKYNGGTMVNYDVKKNAEYFAKVYMNAVELFAFLCKENNLDPMKDIVCHSEVHQLGYGSNHADVMQWFPRHGKSMDAFRIDVKALLDASYKPKSTIAVNSSPDDINWLKLKINNALIGNSYIPLELNGVYDNKTRIAVLILWESFGWNKDGADDGWRAGKKTIDKLA